MRSRSGARIQVATSSTMPATAIGMACRPHRGTGRCTAGCCRQCGALNERGAETCGHCGAKLHQQRVREIVNGGRLAEALDAPLSLEDIQAMPYVNALRWAWAAGKNGRFNKDRLEQIAYARGYKGGWVFYKMQQTLDEALQEHEQFKKTSVRY